MLCFCKDFQISSNIYVGCRVLARDSASCRWRAGAAVARREEGWEVHCDFGETCTHVCKNVEALEASSSVLATLDLLHSADMVPCLIRNMSSDDRLAQLYSIRMLGIFTDLGSPAMRTSIVEAGGVKWLLSGTMAGAVSALDALGPLCANSKAACKMMHSLGAVPILIDHLCIADGELSHDSVDAERKLDIMSKTCSLLCLLFEGDNEMRSAGLQSG